MMRSVLAIAAVVVFAAGCSDDEGEQRPGRIDGPAELDPEFVENRTDTRSDPGG